MLAVSRDKVETTNFAFLELIFHLVFFVRAETPGKTSTDAIKSKHRRLNLLRISLLRLYSSMESDAGRAKCNIYNE